MAYCTFSITFAVEVLIEDEKFNDNIENDNTFVDLGLWNQGVKIQYTLYPGYNYDLDILIWPNAGKIWCGNQYGWARAWQFLNKYWIAFTIRHKIPVKVEEFLDHQIFITPGSVTAFGNNAKNDRNFLVRIPPLEFRELRYFAKIEETEVDIIKSIIDLVWRNVLNFIPPSYLDGLFDTPEPVTDSRHQDTILSYIKENVLSTEINKANNAFTEIEASNLKEKGKKVGVETEHTVYKLKLTGDAIIAGSGRINHFQELGQCSPNQGRILAILSSSNLPTPDDLPVIVININALKRIPLKELISAGFFEIYTRWKIGALEHNSQKKPLVTQTEVPLGDYHVIPIKGSLVREISNVFVDNSFEIELHGVRDATKLVNRPKLFNDDCSCKFLSATNDNKESDELIACTRIDTQHLLSRPNKMISGDFSFYPPQSSYFNLKRYCTNHVNATKISRKYEKHFSPSIVLSTNMAVELSIGFLGCEIHLTRVSFSRLYCFCVKGNTASKILNKIEEINEKALISTNKENILTGFSIDTGNSLIIFVEGQKNRNIMKIWEISESFDTGVKIIFSTSETYLERVFPESETSDSPFEYLKMRISLPVLLACPSVYVRPTLPLPAKIAMLKISHILMGKIYKTPFRNEIPTAAELQSFKLELCLPLRLHSSKEIAFNP